MEADLAAWMAEPTKRVQVESRFIEDELFRPLWSRYRAFAGLNPATTVLLTVFAGLSVLPLTIFLAFSTLVLSTLAFFALGGVGFVSVCVVGSALGVLLVALGVAMLVSSLVAVVPFNTLILYRLIVHLTGSERSSKGFSNWIAETRSRMGIPARPQAPIYDEREQKGKFMF